MKQITVSAAVILRTNPQTHKHEILATQRGYGDFKGGWEFPGGMKKSTFVQSKNTLNLSSCTSNC